MNARLTPSKAITTYDPSDDQETIRELGILYDHRLLRYRGRALVVLLARAFISCYGQWISHRGLRHAILTHLCDTHGIRSHIHALHAYQYLQQKLNSPVEIDDADLCVSFLLALSRPSNESLRIHANGAFAIMRHLSRRQKTKGSSSALSAVWHMIRDEIISELLINDPVAYVRLREGFEEVLGHEILHHRETYRRDLSIG